VYTLTADGEAALRSWLEAAQVEPDQIRSQFLLKVFFGQLASRRTVLEMVKQRRDEAEETASQLRQIEQDIQGEEAWLYPYLTLKYGLSRADAIVRWADEVVHLLEESED
jgi:hypothetical protein